MNLKDTDGALRDYNTAIEMDPKMRVADRNREFLKIEMGQRIKDVWILVKRANLGIGTNRSKATAGNQLL